MRIGNSKTIQNRNKTQKKATPGAILSSELLTHNTLEFYTRLNTPSEAPKPQVGGRCAGVGEKVGFVQSNFCEHQLCLSNSFDII